MNKKLFSCSRIWMIVILFLFQCSASIAQKVETDTIDGTSYYVYPFGTELSIHNNYYLAVKRPKGLRYTYKDYYKSSFGEDYNKKEYRKAKREMRRNNWQSRSTKKRLKHYNKAFKQAVRKNPFPLLEQKYSLENDIIPSLDPIPEGKYVQYFSGYYPINKKGKMTYEEQRVAGFFSIKNNMLDGEAVWFNVKGDTLKKGRFEAGLKVGDWTLEVRKAPYSLGKEDAKKYIERGYPDMDTTKEIVHYADGFKNGYYASYMNSANPIQEGFYTNNEATGQWKERAVGYLGKGKNRKRNRNNDVITWSYSYASADSVVKQTLIRRKLLREESYNSRFDFDSKYDPSISLTRLYSINFPEEVDLELDEEKMNSYEGDVYEEDEYEDEMYLDQVYMDDYEPRGIDDDENYSFRNMIYDPNSGEYRSLAKLVDSLGVKFNYEGIYEKRYPNGQLMVRYEFKEGKLLEEDTIYWDNGKPYDVIAFQADSSQYIHYVYDYNGKLFNEIVYDAKGEFKRVNFKPANMNYVNIDGYLAEDRGYGKYYFYDKLDTLENILNDSLIIFRSWAKSDTSLLYSRTLIPSEKTLRLTSYSVLGTPSFHGELKFSDSYDSWTGKKEYILGDLALETTTSASFSEWAEKDSIPQRHMNEFSGDLFDLTEDRVLRQKGKPYTGEFSVLTNEKKFSLQSGKSLKIAFPRFATMIDDLNKDLENYHKTGKTKNEILFGSIDATEIDEDFGSGIYGLLFDGFIGGYVEYPYSEYYEYEMPDRTKYREKKEQPFAKKIDGYFKDGKPQGTWKVYDQFGKLIIEIPFEKGTINGTMKEYDNVYPREEMDYFMSESEYLADSVPPKKKHYLYATTEFKNGFRNGEYNRYNWLGTMNEQILYKDGFKEGKAFERNNLAYTSLNYKDGSLDGYVRTYLTLKGQDSLLLFDLNFQNGLLQGESKSYHTSGRLAKKGFFLNGDPIDDYEAFDTLGFKYHYVKFMYSFPVEEKIWEENELSVRYLFDWRDSIYFQPTDITSTQSLDRVLAQLGIGSEYFNRPYYGRPSLVRKEGIDYHITKYYPNDTIARDGSVSSGKKVSCWKYYSYEGEFLYEVDYFDTIIRINDSIQFKAKGILTDYNAKGDKISESYIIEKFEKYDCSHTDHYEIRQLMTIWQEKDSVDRMNGYVKNYYDNGVLQNEGMMKDGLPTGVWKFYDPYGKLNQVGAYVMGKRDGRWLGGDLSKTKYLGDICLNPNLPDLEEELKYREKLLDIMITNYKLGKALNKEFYDVNLNEYEEATETDDSEVIEE